MSHMQGFSHTRLYGDIISLVLFVFSCPRSISMRRSCVWDMHAQDTTSKNPRTPPYWPTCWKWEHPASRHPGGEWSQKIFTWNHQCWHLGQVCECRRVVLGQVVKQGPDGLNIAGNHASLDWVDKISVWMSRWWINKCEDCAYGLDRIWRCRQRWPPSPPSPHPDSRHTAPSAPLSAISPI